MHPLFLRNVVNQTKSELKQAARQAKVTENLGLIAARGALLGFCHLTIQDLTLGFLETELDPLGTREANVDHKTS